MQLRERREQPLPLCAAGTHHFEDQFGPRGRTFRMCVICGYVPGEGEME